MLRLARAAARASGAHLVDREPAEQRAQRDLLEEAAAGLGEPNGRGGHGRLIVAAGLAPSWETTGGDRLEEGPGCGPWAGRCSCCWSWPSWPGSGTPGTGRRARPAARRRRSRPTRSSGTGGAGRPRSWPRSRPTSVTATTGWCSPSRARCLGYQVRYVPQVTGAGGRRLALRGEAFVEVTFEPARARDPDGTASFSATTITPSSPVLRQVRFAGDFEGQVQVRAGGGRARRLPRLRAPQPDPGRGRRPLNTRATQGWPDRVV